MNTTTAGSITSLEGDTIAAIATPPGRGGIGIIRLSGNAARSIGERICNQVLQPRHAHYCAFSDSSDGETLDAGIALFFPGPDSFTGEDVVELQAHGGPVVLDMLLKACCGNDARLARPGEFSERAFLNGKLDLAQAEAIADLINSTTDSAARSANRSLQGEFSHCINELVTRMTQLRVYVEAAIDFPEEEIDFLRDGHVLEKLQSIIMELERVTGSARQGRLLREGMKLVIAGRPNAGKSSLLNALSGQDSAIVTAVAGTTRDVLREHIQIDGMPLHIVDTAGLREGRDAVEREGIRRAWLEMDSADRILLVVDSTNNADTQAHASALWPQISDRLGAGIPMTFIHNKCDLSGSPPKLTLDGDDTVIALSATTGDGIELLRDHLKQSMGYHSGESGQFSARRRHLDALERAAGFLDAGLDQLQASGAGELLAEDLRYSQGCLGEITGAVSSDELLGEIFSSFCIGK